MMIGQIRQGDVLLIPVEVQPPAALLPQDEVILALGEITGHAHRLGGTVLEWTEGDKRYVRVLERPGILTHEEHDPIPVPVVPPEQTFRVVAQREWDLSEQWRKVTD